MKCMPISLKNLSISRGKFLFGRPLDISEMMQTIGYVNLQDIYSSIIIFEFGNNY